MFELLFVRSQIGNIHIEAIEPVPIYQFYLTTARSISFTISYFKIAKISLLYTHKHKPQQANTSQNTNWSIQNNTIVSTIAARLDIDRKDEHTYHSIYIDVDKLCLSHRSAASEANQFEMLWCKIHIVANAKQRFVFEIWCRNDCTHNHHNRMTCVWYS